MPVFIIYTYFNKLDCVYKNTCPNPIKEIFVLRYAYENNFISREGSQHTSIDSIQVSYCQRVYIIADQLLKIGPYIRYGLFQRHETTVLRFGNKFTDRGANANIISEP